MRKLLTCCQYKKPRHSRSDNRYAFIGINIDTEKAVSISAHADKMQKDTTKQSFNIYLNNIKDNANKILHTLYDSVYPKQLHSAPNQEDYNTRIRNIRNRLYGNTKDSK